MLWVRWESGWVRPGQPNLDNLGQLGPTSQANNRGQPMDNQQDRANFTIKDFLISDRKLALEAANRRDEPMREFVGRAVRTQANLDAGDKVFFPGQLEENLEPTGQPIDLATLEEVARVSGMMAQAYRAGAPAEVARTVYEGLWIRAEIAMGLPARKRRRRVTMGELAVKVGQVGQDGQQLALE